MKRTSVRSLFLVTFLVLPLQYALVGLGTLVGLGEPWPAVVQPGFQSVWDGGGAVTVLSPEFRVVFDDGDSADAPPRRVFASVPASHHLGIMRTHFDPSKNETVDPRTRSWLGDRFEALFGRRPARTKVIWYEVHVGWNAEAPRRVPVDTLGFEIPRNE